MSARFGLRPRFQVLVVLGIGRLWQGVFWAIFLFLRFRPLAWLAGAGLPMFGRGARSGSIAAVLRVGGASRAQAIATAFLRRGSLVGMRSGAPAPRSRMRPAENGPMPGNSSSRASASRSGRDLRCAASSFSSVASRARRRRYSIFGGVRPGKSSSVSSFSGPGKACSLTPWTSTVGPSSVAMRFLIFAACTIRMRWPIHKE